MMTICSIIAVIIENEGVVNEGVIGLWDGKTPEVVKVEKKRERQHNWQQKALYAEGTEGKRTKNTCM